MIDLGVFTVVMRPGVQIDFHEVEAGRGVRKVGKRTARLAARAAHGIEGWQEDDGPGARGFHGLSVCGRQGITPGGPDAGDRPPGRD